MHGRPVEGKRAGGTDRSLRETDPPTRIRIPHGSRWPVRDRRGRPARARCGPHCRGIATFTNGSTFQLLREDGVLVPAEGTGSPDDLRLDVLAQFLEGDDPVAVEVGVALAQTPHLWYSPLMHPRAFGRREHLDQFRSC